jgi:hypothetical protein
MNKLSFHDHTDYQGNFITDPWQRYFISSTSHDYLTLFNGSSLNLPSPTQNPFDCPILHILYGSQLIICLN